MSKSLASVAKSYEDRPPSFDLRGNYLPKEIESLDIDDEVEFVIKAKLSRLQKGGYHDYCCEDDDEIAKTRKRVEASFQIVSVKSNGKIQPENMTVAEKKAAAISAKLARK